MIHRHQLFPSSTASLLPKKLATDLHTQVRRFDFFQYFLSCNQWLCLDHVTSVPTGRFSRAALASPPSFQQGTTDEETDSTPPMVEHINISADVAARLDSMLMNTYYCYVFNLFLFFFASSSKASKFTNR